MIESSADLAVRRDLALLGLPPAKWTASRQAPDGSPAADVVVIGAGMGGLAVAGALSLRGIGDVRLIDRSPAGREGPWITYARMDTLRSPKTLAGPALGIPSLTFRAWYETTFGMNAWETLYKIPNAVWQDYLGWFGRVLGLGIENAVGVAGIEPSPDLVAVRRDDGSVTWARRVVLATGRAGAGGLHIPDFVDRALWPDHAAHSAEAIDFGGLAGRAVAVVGGSASAWDNAATALEQGAAAVDMYVRRTALPQINKGRGSAGPGYFLGWQALDDDARWDLAAYIEDNPAPPPHETVHRTLRHQGFRIHLGTPVMAAMRDGGAVALRLADGTIRRHDFLILGTGFAVDLAMRPELAALAPAVATWADRYAPARQRPGLGRYPYLGAGFELQERAPGALLGLGRIHLFNHGAQLSHGTLASDIPGVSVGAGRLADALARAFFREDQAEIRQALDRFDEPELAGTPFFVARG
jgi:cation diffusion facilitator CzcD-associated flavoprotein CzcO